MAIPVGSIISAAGSVLGGTIGSVGSALGSRRGAKVARENTDKTIAAQYNLANQAYEKNLEQWHRENEYNSPLAQIQRYTEAGLNPNLIYGTSGSAGNSSGSPQFSAPNVSYDYSGASPAGSALSAAAGTFQQIAGQAAAVSNQIEQNKVLREQRRGIELDNERKAEENMIDFEPIEFTRYTEAISPDGSITFSDPVVSQTNRRRRERDAIVTGREYSTRGTELENLITERTIEPVIAKIEQDLLNAQSRGKLIDQDYLLRLHQTLSQKLENEYRELGVSNTDNLVFRIIARALHSLYPSLKF